MAAQFRQSRSPPLLWPLGLSFLLFLLFSIIPSPLVRADDGESCSISSCSSSSSSSSSPPPSSPSKLRDIALDEVDSVLEEVEHLLVEVYLPNCKHCVKLTKQLEEAAPTLSAFDPPITVAKVDGSKRHTLSKGVLSFPHTRLFIRGKQVAEWSGGQPHLDKFLTSVKRHVLPPVQSFSSGVAARDFASKVVDEYGGLFIGFGMEEHALKSAAAKARDRMWFAVVPKPEDETRILFDYDKEPAIVALHAGGEQHTFYGPFEGQDMDEFMERRSMPLIVPANHENFRRIMTSSQLKAMVLAEFGGQMPLSVLQPMLRSMSEKAKKATQFVRGVIPVANSNARLLFTYMDTTVYPEFYKSLGISPRALPTVVLMLDGGSFYAPDNETLFHDEERMPVNLLHFIADVITNKVPLRKRDVSIPSPGPTNVLANPNLYWALLIVLVAVLMKWRRGGKNVILPDMPAAPSSSAAAAAAKKDA